MVVYLCCVGLGRLWNNLPPLFPFFFLVLSLLTAISLSFFFQLKSPSRVNRDMMHIKQARDRAGWLAGRHGRQGEKTERFALFFVSGWIFCWHHLDWAEQRRAEQSALHIKASEKNRPFIHSFFNAPNSYYMQVDLLFGQLTTIASIVMMSDWTTRSNCAFASRCPKPSHIRIHKAEMPDGLL